MSYEAVIGLETHEWRSLHAVNLVSSRIKPAPTVRRFQGTGSRGLNPA
jgi:hypothetical protein